MLPEIYSKSYGFPKMFFHKGMIYEWSGEAFSDMSGLIFEVKAPPGSNVSIADVMEKLPGDPMFSMLLAIYYNFTVTDMAIRTQIIDDESFTYLTCIGTRSQEQYRAWNESNYPLFTSDVCAPTHLLVETTQPYCETVSIGPDKVVEIRGEMYTELRKPMNWVDEYRFLFGYAINVHCGVEGFAFLTDEAEEYFKGLLEAEPARNKDVLLPIDPGMTYVIQKRVMDSVSYHLSCLGSFLSPLHFLKIKFEVSWLNTTSSYFSSRNLDMTAVAKAGNINGVFVKTCTLYGVTVEPKCHSGVFFNLHAPHVRWSDIYHSIGRISTALQSNSSILMLCGIADREIVYADNKQYIGVTTFPMPINFGEPAVPHSDSQEVSKFIDELQPFFFAVDEHETEFAFPVTDAVHDDFCICFVKMDMYYAKSGGLDEFRKKINCMELGIEVLADTSTFLYFAVVDMGEVAAVLTDLPAANKIAFDYSFCGFYGHVEEWDDVSLTDALAYLIKIITDSPTPAKFILEENVLYMEVIKMCRKCNVWEREAPAMAWEQNAHFCTREGFQGAWATAMNNVFSPPPMSPAVEQAFEDLGIDKKYWDRHIPTETKKDEPPSKLSTWQKIKNIFKKS